MLKSLCCKKPVYLDTVDTGDRIGKSICVKIVYKCSKCHKLTGAVTWADAGMGEQNEEERNG